MPGEKPMSQWSLALVEVNATGHYLSLLNEEYTYKTHKGCCTILVVGAVSVYFLLTLAALLKEYLHVTKQKCFTFVIIQYLVSVQGNTRFKRQKFCFNHSPWWSLTKVRDKRHCRKKWHFFFFQTISCEKRDVIALYLMLYLRVYVKAMVCFNLNK